MSMFIKHIRVSAFPAAAMTFGCHVSLVLNEDLCNVQSAIIARVGPTSSDSRDKKIHQADIRAAKKIGREIAKELCVPCKIN